jgi:uncharacterized membrane protein YfcA
MIGFGGGAFAIPALVLLFHVPIQIAIGSTMLSLVPSSLVATVQNIRYKTVDFVLGLVFEITTVMGAFFGAMVTSKLSGQTLKICFAVLLLFISYRMYQKSRGRDWKAVGEQSFIGRLNRRKPVLHRTKVLDGVERKYSAGGWLLGSAGAVAGFLAGLLGIGGGFLKTPVMVLIFSLPMRLAVGTSLFMITMTTAVGSATHFAVGDVDKIVTPAVMAGFIVGALIGPRLSRRLKSTTLEQTLAIALVIVSILMTVPVK